MQVSQLDGVYSVQEPHFWTLCSEVYIGTVKLEVAANADSKYILSQTHNIFTQVSHVDFFLKQPPPPPPPPCFLHVGRNNSIF